MTNSLSLYMNKAKQKMTSFWRNEQGIGTLEVVLIIAVVVIIFIVFKDFIVGYVNKLVNQSQGKLDDTFK